MKVTKNSSLVSHQGKYERPSFITVLPTFGMIPLEHHIASLRLANPLNASSEIMSIRGEEIGFARNYAVESILKMQRVPKYIFFYGDDMIPEWNALIELYTEIDKGDFDILGALYYMKQSGVPTPILWRDGQEGALQVDRDYELGEIVLSDISGMDFTLIRTDLFKELTPPYFKTGPTEISSGEIWVHTEDSWFCQKAKKEANAKIGVHTGVRVAHLDVKTGEIY